MTRERRPSRILVTGAAGFIGSHLCERLLSAGQEVVGLDSFDSFYDPGVKERNLEGARASRLFREIRGDIRDPAVYDRLPSRHRHRHPPRGTRRRAALDRAAPALPRREPPKDPGDRPVSPYAATKRSGELLVHTYAHLFGIDALRLRFFTVYGPRQRPDLAIHKFTRLMSEGREIPMYGDGTSQRDYTEIEDILDGIVGALDYITESPGTFDIVNLGGARTISLRRMIDQVAEALGTEPRIRQMKEQPGDVRRTFADVSKAARLFSHQPRVPFEVGVRRFVDSYVSDRACERAATPVHAQV